MDEIVDIDSMAFYRRPCGLRCCVTLLDFYQVVAGVEERPTGSPIKVATFGQDI